MVTITNESKKGKVSGTPFLLLFFLSIKYLFLCENLNILHQESPVTWKDFSIRTGNYRLPKGRITLIKIYSVKVEIVTVLLLLNIFITDGEPEPCTDRSGRPRKVETTSVFFFFFGYPKTLEFKCLEIRNYGLRFDFGLWQMYEIKSKSFRHHFVFVGI